MDGPREQFRAPFDPAHEPGRLARVSPGMLKLLFRGTIAAHPPSPARAWAVRVILGRLGHHTNGTSSPPGTTPGNSAQGRP